MSKAGSLCGPKPDSVGEEAVVHVLLSNPSGCLGYLGPNIEKPQGGIGESHLYKAMQLCWLVGFHAGPSARVNQVETCRALAAVMGCLEACWPWEIQRQKTCYDVTRYDAASR